MCVCVSTFPWDTLEPKQPGSKWLWPIKQTNFSSCFFTTASRLKRSCSKSLPRVWTLLWKALWAHLIYALYPARNFLPLLLQYNASLGMVSAEDYESKTYGTRKWIRVHYISATSGYCANLLGFKLFQFLFWRFSNYSMSLLLHVFSEIIILWLQNPVKPFRSVGESVL